MIFCIRKGNSLVFGFDDNGESISLTLATDRMAERIADGLSELYDEITLLKQRLEVYERQHLVRNERSP